MKSKSAMLKLLLFVTSFQLAVNRGISQNDPSGPEDEMSLTLKVVSGKIIYGADGNYITEPHSVYLQAGLRYDYPLRISSRRSSPAIVAITGQAGFLFCKAKTLDPLLFKTRNPSYFVISSGIYNKQAFSLGTELFFWKGLGHRDMWGAIFPAIGYNGKNIRLYATAEHYWQVINSGNRGTVFAVDLCWKLIKGK